MDWDNIDLNSNYEKDQPVLDPYTVNMLLLEIHCNMRTENITKENVMAHIDYVLNSFNHSAKEIFFSNLDNIVEYAKKERDELQ